MFKWLHHLFTPHCPECFNSEKYLIDKLSLMLEQERAEKFRLLTLLAPSGHNQASPSEMVDLSTLTRSPRAVMRDLERKSAEEAVRIRKRNDELSIQNLETEAGLNG